MKKRLSLSFPVNNVELEVEDDQGEITKDPQAFIKALDPSQAGMYGPLLALAQKAAETNNLVIDVTDPPETEEHCGGGCSGCHGNCHSDNAPPSKEDE